MDLPLTERCSLNSTRFAMKIGALARGKCQLSFALRFFSSIGTCFAKKELSENFARIPDGTSLMHRCSVNIARNGINYTELCKSTSQVSFALLLSKR
jgi:hypothetical protein